MEATSKVARMFREFIKNHEIVLEGRGRSMGSNWKLPITDEMAYFTSVFPGIPLRSKIIRWFMTEGMVKASQGRDELAKMVNRILEANPSMPVKFGGTTSGTAIGEATSAYEYHDEATIYPHDLFSPEARQRHPFLQGKFLPGGKTIDEYYQEHYEPTYMDILDVSGDWHRIDIARTNHIVSSKGLPPFHYGGVNGYLQYVEKGDYLPAKQQRSHQDPNGQHGPDLSRAKMDMSNDGSPIASFHGGAVNMESRKYGSAVSQSQAKFNMFAQKIQQGETVSGLSDEQTEVIKKLLEMVDGVKKVEKSAGKYSLSRTLGLDIRTRKEEFTAEASLIQKAIMDGLKQEIEFREDIFGLSRDEMARYHIIEGDYDPEAITKDPKGSGQYMVKARYSDIAAKVFYDHFMAEYPDFVATTLTPVRVLLNSQEFNDYVKRRVGDDAHSDMVRKMKSVLPTASNPKAPGNNRRERLASVLNRGFRSDPDLHEDMKFVAYEMEGVAPEHVVTKLETRPSLFAEDALAAMSEVPDREEELTHKGYRWIIKNPISDYEKEHQRPDWSAVDADGNYRRTSAVLGYSVVGEDYHDVIKITRDQDGRLHAQIPISGGGTVRALKDYGMPTGMMAGGKQVPAGTGMGHLNLNPVHSKQQWDELVQRLLNGEMGEPSVGATEITQTKSVIEGAIGGVNWSHIKSEGFLPNIGEIKASTGRDDLKGSFTGGDAHISGTEVLNWAAEGLWSLSGDRAFQIGYVSDEITDRWDQEDAATYARGLAQAKEDPDFDEDEYEMPKGIAALLINKAGVQSDQDLASLQDEITAIPGDWWDVMLEWADNGKTPQGKTFNDEMLQAFGKNAFLARVDVAKRYVANKCQQAYKSWSREKSGDSMMGGDDDRKGGHFADIKGAMHGDRGQEYEKDPDPLSPADKRDVFGVEDPNTWQGFKGRAESPPDKTPPPPPPPAATGGSLRDRLLKNKTQATQTTQTTQAKPAPVLAKAPPQQVQPAAGSLMAKLAQKRAAAQAQQSQQQAPPQPQAPETLMQRLKRQRGIKEHFRTYQQWRETWAVYDGTKPKDGCGFNWWGAVGDPLGVSINGDPIKKGKRYGKRKGRKEK